MSPSSGQCCSGPNRVGLLADREILIGVDTGKVGKLVLWGHLIGSRRMEIRGASERGMIFMRGKS